MQETQELMEKGALSGSVYKEYFMAGAGVFTLALLFVFILLAQAVSNGGDIWLTNW